jgi:hypothetical protein
MSDTTWYEIEYSRTDEENWVNWSSREWGKDEGLEFVAFRNRESENYQYRLVRVTQSREVL